MGAFGFNTSGQFTVNGTPANYGKNYIINGGFDYWSYATSQTTSGYGSDDRWRNENNGSTKVHSLVNATDTERALFNSSKFSRTVVTSVVGVNNFVTKQQRIENVTKLAGKTVTISFWAKADSSKNISIEFAQAFGTGGTPSSGIDGISPHLVALTSTWQKKTITITLPSIIGKTLGTDGVHTTNTNITFWFDAGSNFNARTASLGQQSGTFDIAEVQLEEGSIATPFENRPYGLELSLCQDYFKRMTGYSIGVYDVAYARTIMAIEHGMARRPTTVTKYGQSLLGHHTDAPQETYLATSSAVFYWTGSSARDGAGITYDYGFSAEL